jgi:hypothetical protein
MGGSRSSSSEIEVLRQLICGIRAGQAQDPIALAEGQERGFGLLMSLEAQLQRARRGSREVAGAVQLAPPDVATEVQELMDAIAHLSAALTELRALVSPEGSPPRVGYGFVLPSRRTPRVRRHAGPDRAP